MAFIKHCVRKAVSTLVIDNPPINAISSVVINELCAKLDTLEKHNETEVIVLMGKNDTFSAGADIREFDHFRKGQRQVSLELFHAVERLEACNKPVVAYIRQFAFGGGLELALGCHYRIGHANSRLGLPEVKIGLIPGAQGTQRLPRVVDLEKAIRMICYGRHIYAKEAVNWQLLDKVVATDGAMLDYAATLAGKPFAEKKVSQMGIKKGDNAERIIKDYDFLLRRKSKGMDAPLLGLEAITAALNASKFEDGVAVEAKLFQSAMSSGQSKSMQYVFQAERKAARLPRALTSVVPSQVNRVAIVGGLGTMGSGIATAFLVRGFSVLLIEQNQELADKAAKKVHKLSKQSVELGRARNTSIETLSLTDWTRGNHVGLCGVSMSDIGGTSDQGQAVTQALHQVELVVESIQEDMEAKKAVFELLDKSCTPGTFLCTNSSTLDIDKLAGVTKRPARVSGLHFFNPAYFIPIVEVVKGKSTGPAALSTLHNVSKRLGKISVMTGNCFGFCGNRMLVPYMAESVAILLQDQGTLDPSTVDEVMEDHFGMTLGPFRMMDLIGIDVIQSIQAECDKAFASGDNERFSGNPLANDKFRNVINMMCEQGRLGRKTGKGWYSYKSGGDKKYTPDPELLKLIGPIRNSTSLEKPAYPDANQQQEIVERCVYALINEGFKILEEDIVSFPEIIDTVWVSAYGWPKSRGGPIYHARNIGLNMILDRVQHYQKEFNDVSYWKPSDLLCQLINDSSLLDKWSSQKSKL